MIIFSFDIFFSSVGQNYEVSLLSHALRAARTVSLTVRRVLSEYLSFMERFAEKMGSFSIFKSPDFNVRLVYKIPRRQIKRGVILFNV